ncbi:hypothetical protein Tco_0484883 [Tanacetum coccineum]
MLPQVQTLSLFRLVMIVVSKVIRGTDVQRRSSKRKLEKLMDKLMPLRMLSHKSFVNTRFSSMLDIDPVKIDVNYEVELAAGRVLNAVIFCGEKVVRIPYGNKRLTVKSDKGVYRLKKKLKEKRLEDVPVIRGFPEVFLKDLSELPPPRQVEF